MDDNLNIEFEEDYRHLVMSNEVEQYLYLKILQILKQNESIKKIGFINVSDYLTNLPSKDYSKKNKIEVIEKKLLHHEFVTVKNKSTTISFKKDFIETFKNLDLIFMQSQYNLSGSINWEFDLLNLILKDNGLAFYLSTDRFIRKFPKNYRDSDLYLTEVINLQRCYAPKTFVEINAFVLSKKIKEKINLIATTDVIKNYEMKRCTIGKVKKIGDIQSGKSYMGPIPNLNINLGEEILISEQANSPIKAYEEIDINLQKEKILQIIAEEYVSFDQSFAILELEKLLAKEKIDLEELLKVQIDNGKIKFVKDNIKKFNNTIYIPTVFSKNKKVENDWSKLKDWDYYYFNLNIDTHDASYVAYFLNSYIGRLQFKVIKELNSESIKKLKIPIMNLDEQKLSSHTHKKFQILENNLEKIKKDSVYKPQQVDADTVFANIPDHTIKKLITAPESGTHEYKSTLRYGLNSKRVDDDLTHSCLKTITAFLNTNGGNLLIGVDDNKNVLGIEIDIFQTQDKYLRYLKEVIKKRIGVVFLEKDILINFIPYEGKTICHIKCNKIPNNEISYLYNKKAKINEIYKRSTSTSDKLEGKELVDWVKKRK